MTSDLIRTLVSDPQVKDFFLARQPILDRDRNLVAYELLFRSTKADDSVIVLDDLRETATTVANTSELGIENVVGNKLGFFNADAAVLMSDLVGFLPCDKVVLEILETVRATPELIQRVCELRSSGYTFALDDVTNFSEDIEKLLPLVKIVKLDIYGMARSSLEVLIGQLKHLNKILLAESRDNRTIPYVL